jgi:hypothetical protein
MNKRTVGVPGPRSPCKKSEMVTNRSLEVKPSPRLAPPIWSSWATAISRIVNSGTTPPPASVPRTEATNRRHASNRVGRAVAVATLLTSITSTWATREATTALAQGRWAEYSSEAGRISYELPSAWNVQNEDNLQKAGYLTAPYSTYTLIGGAEPARLSGVPNPPDGYAFSETPSPWFLVVVKTGTSAAPSPSNAYQLAPDGEASFQEQQGLDPRVVSLTQPLHVSSGGLQGSEDRSEVIVPGAGDIELNEVVYAKGETIWMAMVGCTVACYNASAATLTQVIDSVKVGTASLTVRT